MLDPDLFAKNLRVARRGAAGGPSGMTSEHLRPLLENHDDMTGISQDLARAAVSEDVVDLVRWDA